MLNADVIDIDRLVVQLAPVGDAALQAGDALLKLHEVFVGLQLRIGLGDGKQAAQTAAQRPLRLAQRPDIAGLPSRMHRCPRLDDALQGFLLELLILFAHLDQLGQFIVPLLEQHVNIGPGLGNTMFACNQSVIQLDAIDDEHDQ